MLRVCRSGVPEPKFPQRFSVIHPIRGLSPSGFRFLIRHSFPRNRYANFGWGIPSRRNSRNMVLLLPVLISANWCRLVVKLLSVWLI